MEIVLDLVKFTLAFAAVLVLTSLFFTIIFDAYFSSRLRYMRKLNDLTRNPQP